MIHSVGSNRNRNEVQNSADLDFTNEFMATPKLEAFQFWVMYYIVCLAD